MGKKDDFTKRSVPLEVYDERYYWEQDGPGGWQLFLETRGRSRPQGGGYLQSLGQLGDGMRMLDVGCGRGELVFRCVRDHQALGIGIDYSAAAVSIARGVVYEFATEEQKDRMLFIKADAQQMPFRSRSLDVIFSHHMVEHLYPEQMQKMFDECRRILRKEGRLVLQTGPNLWRLRYGFPITRFAYRLSWLAEIYQRVMNVQQIPRKARSEEDMRLHVGEQSVVSLKKVLQQSGFDGKVWVGKDQSGRFSRQSFRKRLGAKGLFVHQVYQLLYETYPLNLVFGDVIYAVAYPVGP